jgi:hypothetical protein
LSRRGILEGNGVKIIGAGFGRTGTLSLKNALEQLGFDPCCHMLEVAWRAERARLWLDAAQGMAVDWSQVLAGYQATVDWPGCAFYGELMEAFPDAQVILTVRDPEAWYESARKTINDRPSARPPTPDDTIGTQMIRAVVWQGSMEGAFDDKAKAIDIYNRHNEEVRRRVPADRLLVFEARQGWEPLCDFLGVPVPAGSYPHLNERSVFNDRKKFEFLARQTVKDHPGFS